MKEHTKYRVIFWVLLGVALSASAVGLAYAAAQTRSPKENSSPTSFSPSVHVSADEALSYPVDI